MERVLIGSDAEILVGRGRPRPLLPEKDSRRRAAVITQATVRNTAGEVEDSLSSEGLEVFTLVMPDREEAKTLAAVESAYGWLAELGVGRGDTVVAVGGGALTDAAGFVAGTWMRGIEVVHLPTTLLGAVDASIGGKTAINFAGKNLVGVFWQASRVIVDLEVLERLPIDLRRQGAAEVIKAGLLAAPHIVDAYLEHGVEAPLEAVVAAAIRVKADLVSADFTERGERALLNLGHTIGHGVEFASGLSHGEAVAIGLVGEAAVSERLLGFSESARVMAALEATGLPVASPPLDRDEVMRLIGLDKKRTTSGIRMVLLEALGRPRLVTVTDADVSWGLDAIGV